MVVTVDEAKNYLRVDTDEDDALIADEINAAEKICRDILRTERNCGLKKVANAKIAVLYAVAYMYEHREEADYNALTLSLRALLSGSREARF